MRLHGGRVIAQNDPQVGASLSLVFPLVADDG
jgi:signal transduction histidine kinase